MGTTRERRLAVEVEAKQCTAATGQRVLRVSLAPDFWMCNDIPDKSQLSSNGEVTAENTASPMRNAIPEH
jgi:hypothetical protein